MKQVFVTAVILALAVIGSATAQDNTLAEIRNLVSNDVRVDGFVLDKDQEISIHGVGGGSRTRDLYTSAWILNKQSREVIWKLTQAKRSSYSRGLTEFDDRCMLPRGEYEVYYAALPGWYENIDGFGELMEFLSDRIFHPNRRREYQELSLTIEGTGRRVAAEGVDAWHEALRKNALISLTGVWDNDYVRQGFLLEKPMELTVYAIGEANDDGLFDYSWIIDARSGNRVWQMTDDNTRHAGGARKNRLASETIALPAGKYVACFVTDGSHSYRDWNAPPPFDPAFWGITIRVQDESMKKFAKLIEDSDVHLPNVLVDLTRLRDDEHQSKAFTLKKPADVRVYAIGEGRDGEMYDYGWIVNAKSRKKIWTMEFRETNHAGGDKKNRVVNTTLHLDSGSYIVYFVTDDSHSYRDWNSAPPYDPEHWGITLNVVSEGFTPKDIGEYYEETADKSVLARLTGIRDDERRRASFTLSQKGEIQIYALGEGRDGEMYDYGWIEDADTRRVVWEMTYRMTEHAGGARKNRVYDGTIVLPAGRYVVFYETDGSHAFNDWNDDPPDDPTSWGITVSLAGKEAR